jgi:hypothetical protein
MVFIGRGFDPDGDGDTDFFIGQQLTPEQSKQAGCGMLAVLAFTMIVVGVIIAADSDGVSALDWLLNPWKNVYSSVAGVIGYIVGFVGLTLVLAGFMQGSTALMIASLLFGGGFAVTFFANVLGIGIGATLALLVGLVGVGVVVLALLTQQK